MSRVSPFPVFIFVIVLLLLCGCSGKQNIPMAPSGLSDFEKIPVFMNDLSDFSIQSQNTSDDPHSIMGTWSASFDFTSMTSSVVQDRELGHYNVSSCVLSHIIINSYDPVTNVADVDITITNPFPINAYDVRLIIYTDDVGHKLLNSDNWTMENDIPGGMVINPFKAYAKDEPNRTFPAYGSYTENFQIYISENPSVSFAIDACYPTNCPEPYLIANFVQNGELLDTMASHDCTLEVDVFDWDADIDQVRLYCPAITGMNFVDFIFDAESKWTMELGNYMRVPAGQYQAIVVAESSGKMLMDVVTLTVSEAPLAEWTIFYYAYEENLYGVRNNFNEMEVVGSVPGTLNMVSLWDITGTVDDAILEIKKDPDGRNNTIISPRIEDFGEVIPDEGLDMHDPETLRRFLTWGIREYPAKKYGYIMLSHGNYGIYSHVPERSFLDDMGVWEFSAAARTALDANGVDKLEFVGLECCTMSFIETAHGLSDVCRVGWSSEFVMYLSSARYDQVLAELVENPQYDAWDFASLFIHNTLTNGGAHTYAAWDSDLVETIAIPAVNVFAQALLDYLPDYRTEITECRTGSDNWGNECEDYRITDLGYFCENLIAFDPPLPVELTDAAQTMRNAISTAVFDMGTNGSGEGCFYSATGWQILFTDRFNDPDEKYQYVRDVISNIGFADATLWDEFLTEYDINEY
jgi:hypothetical protein